MAASSENNLAAIDPFLLRQSFSDMCWLNPASADNQKITIHQPVLYGNHDFSQSDHHHQSSFSPFSSSDHHHLQQTKRRIAAVNNNNGKSRITKRKSRATKKNQTTFITADPANFRQMVQQVTGIRLDTCSSSPLSNLLLKPETTTTMIRPPIGRSLLSCQLPTLDTSSSFLLEEHNQQQQSRQSGALMVDGETGYGASSDGFGIASCFPTLESWKVIM